jgi:hypothetical protein
VTLHCQALRRDRRKGGQERGPRKGSKNGDRRKRSRRARGVASFHSFPVLLCSSPLLFLFSEMSAPASQLHTKLSPYNKNLSVLYPHIAAFLTLDELVWLGSRHLCKLPLPHTTEAAEATATPSAPASVSAQFPSDSTPPSPAVPSVTVPPTTFTKSLRSAALHLQCLQHTLQDTSVPHLLDCCARRNPIWERHLSHVYVNCPEVHVKARVLAPSQLPVPHVLPICIHCLLPC